jgi:hypothetical protein
MNPNNNIKYMSDFTPTSQLIFITVGTVQYLYTCIPVSYNVYIISSSSLHKVTSFYQLTGKRLQDPGHVEAAENGCHGNLTAPREMRWLTRCRGEKGCVLY